MFPAIAPTHLHVRCGLENRRRVSCSCCLFSSLTCVTKVWLVHGSACNKVKQIFAGLTRMGACGLCQRRKDRPIVHFSRRRPAIVLKSPSAEYDNKGKVLTIEEKSYDTALIVTWAKGEKVNRF